MIMLLYWLKAAGIARIRPKSPGGIPTTGSFDGLGS